MLVVDTNVVAYLLIDGDHTSAARELRVRDSDWQSEAFLLVEFTNVLAASIAAKRMTPSLAHDFLTNATALLEGQLRVIAHASVLEMAIRQRVTAHDARFLALAEQLGSRLVTEDARLRAAAPALTQSIAEALAPS